MAEAARRSMTEDNAVQNLSDAEFEAENQDLRGQLTSQASELESLKQQLSALQETSASIVKQRVEEERERLTAEIKQARKDENVDAELEAQAALRKLETAPPVADNPPTQGKGTPQVDQAKQREYQAVFDSFASKHPWIKEDPIKSAAATHFAFELAKQGKLVGLTPEQRGDLIARTTQEYFSQYSNGNGRSTSRVNDGGSRSASGEASSETRSKSYNDLPAAAKADCDRQAKFVVKPGTKIDTEQKFRDYYSGIYFQE